jgi:hypothetical protein
MNSNPDQQFFRSGGSFKCWAFPFEAWCSIVNKWPPIFPLKFIHHEYPAFGIEFINSMIQDPLLASVIANYFRVVAGSHKAVIPPDYSFMTVAHHLLAYFVKIWTE